MNPAAAQAVAHHLFFVDVATTDLEECRLLQRVPVWEETLESYVPATLIRPYLRGRSGATAFAETTGTTGTTWYSKEDSVSFERETLPHELLVATLRDWKMSGAGWDGEGAPAPNSRSIDAAIDFLFLAKWLPVEWEATMHADGRTILEGEGSDLLAELVFEPDGGVSFLTQRGSRQPKVGRLDFDGEVLPGELVAALSVELQAA